MNTRKLFLKLAGASLVAIAASAASLVACSGDNSNGGNPAPTGDSGSASDSTTGGGDTSTGDDSSMGSDTGSSSGGDSGGGMDVVQIDTGGCVSDASTCNTCYSAAQAAVDPYNACSPYTVNCVPFANGTRITGLSSDGGVPLVP